MTRLLTFYFYGTGLHSGLHRSLALLVEFDLLARDETLLQRTSNPHCCHCTLQAHRGRRVVQAARRELVGFGDEGVTETAIVVWGDLASNAVGLVDVDQVRGRLGVDGEFASSTGDFGGCPVRQY